MEWTRVNTGRYKTNDERFLVIKKDEINKRNPWHLTDKKNKVNAYYPSLNDCKMIAEAVVKNENQ